MPQPIIDQIKDALMSTIRGITVAAGYGYDLDVELEDNLEGNVPRDRLCILYRDDEIAETEDAPLGCDQRYQRWLIVCYSYVDPNDDINDRPGRMGADICKALVADYQCGGLAIDTVIENAELFQDRTGVQIKFGTRYQFVYGNPFEQAST
jgi:hypothetical protein